MIKIYILDIYKYKYEKNKVVDDLFIKELLSKQ